MCGRYQRRADKQMIADAFQIGDVDGLHLLRMSLGASLRSGVEQALSPAFERTRVIA
jgi:hypothetical protein